MTLESMSRAEGSLPGSPLEASRLHPSIALAPYVEALVVGRRVAVLGDATLGLADELVARGARLVHAYDPDPARVAEAIARKAPGFGSPAAGRPAARGVVHALLGDDLGVRDGAFDAVLIPDLSAFADRTEVVRRARRLVAPSGAVVVASPNPDAKRRLIADGAPAGGASAAPGLGAPSYYEVFDLLSLQFAVVRMVGQAPFVGYAIVDFAPSREPDVAFDASLMSGTEEPESFVAIASDRPITTDAYLVVEVPAAGVLREARAHDVGTAEGLGDRGPSSARDVRRGPESRVQMAEMQARLVLMEAELDDLRTQKGDLQRQLDAARAAADTSQAAAREAREDAHARAQDAAKATEIQADRWRELEARAGDEHVRAERLTHKVRDLEEELVRQRDRAQKLTKQLEDEKRARQKAEIELGMARGLPRPEPDAEAAARVVTLSEELRQANAREAELSEALRQANVREAELSEALRRASARETELADELRHANAREAELSGAIAHANARADGLANELLAKSRETAELRRELEAAMTRAAEQRREREAAEVKVAELSQALRAAQSKLEEVEEEAQTLRRPLPVREPVVVAGEVEAGVMARFTRVEAAANAERRAAEEARRAAELANAQRDAATLRAETLQTQLDQERNERKDLVMAKAALEAEVVGLKRRLDEALSDRESEAGPEVAHLEAALRDRGHRIAELERDLRESERIGRELIAEIEGLRALAGSDEGNGSGGGLGGARASGAGAGGATGAEAAGPARARGAVDALTADAYQHRIDVLAAEAARKQAELVASTWKIQALEQQVEEARAAARNPAQIQIELSNALVRAQSEIAELRRALDVNGREGTGVPRAVVEDAVLLHQQMGR